MAGAGLGGLAKGRFKRAGNFFFVLGQLVFRAAGDGALDNAAALIDCAVEDAHICFIPFFDCRWLIVCAFWNLVIALYFRMGIYIKIEIKLNVVCSKGGGKDYLS